MNKNPFVPQPGPPAQGDYAAYWAAPQPTGQPYAGQWAAPAAAPAPPRPPAEQSALYANYGYGAQWQRQQQQQQLQALQAQYHPPPPPQPAYNPYQPYVQPVPQFFPPLPPQQPPPPHHLQSHPPAKRPRFDLPKPPPPPPQFQPPPPPPPQNLAFSGPSGPPRPQPNLGPRGPGAGPRGGPRGAPATAPRGAMAGPRGRPGGNFMGGGGGGGRGGSTNSLRGHGSRGNFGNRRGGAIGGGGGSFRTGRQGPSRPRHEGSFSGRDGPSSSFGRKDENRRTLTDFKIIGFDIGELGWTWGVLHKEEPHQVQPAHPLPAPPHIPVPPPSRIRIYFHTPVTPDDARPIPHNSALPVPTTPSDSRKGKRKKLEDDDPDIDDHRAPPPPPQMRTSLTPTASEDWLMAAIVDGQDPEEDEERLHVSQIIQPDNGLHGDVHMWTPEGGSTTELPSEGVPEPESNGTPAEPEPEPEPEPVPVPVSVSVPAALAADDSIASSQPTSLISSVGEHDRDTDADHVPLPDTQVPDPSSVAGAIESLLADADPDAQDPPPLDETETQTQIDELDPVDHLPEPPASPLTTLSTSACGGSPTVSVRKPEPKGRVPSANRLSISYAGGNRRLVVDAEVVESLKLYRQEGRIEVVLNIVKDGDDGLKGILVEGLSDVTKSYLPLQALCDDSECDDTLPPFSKTPIPSTITLRVYLDTARPLSEPKWAKSGDVQEWLKSMFGRMFWVAGDAAEGWEKKIQVVDPDPPPTIWTVLDGWAANSPAGVLTERQRFLRTHMAESDNILEILLRLVRGERATASYQSGPAISAPSVSGPLLSALAHGSAHGAQQTHVSLAVLAMFRMAGEYAKKAAGEQGKAEVEERMGEIVRCLPSHLVYKSLDGIFKEWRVEKKGR